jgi:hypothetical protein
VATDTRKNRRELIGREKVAEGIACLRKEQSMCQKKQKLRKQNFRSTDSSHVVADGIAEFGFRNAE